MCKVPDLPLSRFAFHLRMLTAASLGPFQVYELVQMVLPTVDVDLFVLSDNQEVFLDMQFQDSLMLVIFNY